MEWKRMRTKRVSEINVKGILGRRLQWSTRKIEWEQNEKRKNGSPEGLCEGQSKRKKKSDIKN